MQITQMSSVYGSLLSEIVGNYRMTIVALPPLVEQRDAQVEHLSNLLMQRSLEVRLIENDVQVQLQLRVVERRKRHTG